MNIAAPTRTPARLLTALLVTLSLIAGAALTALPARAATLSGSATSLSWGFYAGWRNYIAGNQPAGSAGSTVASAGAVDNGTTYAWPSVSATLDPDTGAGQASFGGAVNWLKPAHGINLAAASPRLEFAGGAGSLYWTVGGTELLGATVGTVTLGTPTQSGGTTTVSVTGTNLHFTTAGAAQFGAYNSTTVMDDFSFSISYASPSTALPTTVTLAAPRTTTVETGAGVQLSAAVTTGVAGSVEFFDGTTSLGAVAVASNAASMVAVATAAGAHSYSAVFTPTDLVAYSASTSGTQVVTAAARPAALVGNVTGATLDWAVSPYAAFGATNGVAGSGWPATATGGPELLGTSGASSQGFRLTGGTGTADAATGIGAISYPGSVTYTPYPTLAGRFTLSGFVLNVTSATEGTLTAYLSTTGSPSPTAPQIGAAPVTLATFDIASLSGTAGVFSLQSAAPDYVGTVAAGTYSGAYTNAWPASFIQAMDPAFRAFFYQSGSNGASQGNLNKAPLPISASFTATAPTATTLTATSTSVVAGGAVVLQAKVAASIAGSVEFFDGATSVGSVTVVNAAASLRTVVAAGTHSYTAVFTPTLSGSYGSSVSAALVVTTTTQNAPLSGNVSGAELEWGFNAYSAFGATASTAGAGWPATATGGPELLSTTGATPGFRLTGGTGAVDPSTGVGAISFPGEVTYAPYNGVAGTFTLSGFVLTATSPTEGTLTGYLSTTSGPTADAIGLSPVTLATFDIASLTASGAAFLLQSAAPDYANTVAAGTYSGSFTNAWPVSFISAMEAGFRAFFYQSGSNGASQGNLNKAPLPLSATYTVTSTETAVSLTASQTSGLLAGDTVTFTAAVTPTGAAGTLALTVDGAALASAPAGTPLVATSGALATGTHSVVATFTPTNAAAFAPSASDLVVTVAAPGAIAPGSLSWAVYGPFNAYVTGLAAGSITTSNGASGAFRFEQAAGGTYDPATGLGTVNYRGAVRYVGHGGALDLTLSNPVVRINSATSGTLLVTTGGSQVSFASLNLAAATTATSNGAITYSGATATLLAAGASFFGGNYPVGSAIAPVSFTIGSASTANPASSTVAAKPAFVAPATPPATTGLTLDGDAIEGAEVTVTGEGFAAGEKSIHVVIYSTPVVLGTVDANAQGVASWTGELPAGLTGQHTLTLQGSVSRGVVLDIQPAEVETLSAASCAVDDAALTWGFKESFRSYISGSIANGEWTVADGASYETPNFGWSAGAGSYDAASGSGELAFAGSITFTGHAGVLNTTVANPVIVFDNSDTAVIELDVTGTTQEGTPIAQSAVKFVELDLSAATVETSDDGTVTITDAPAVLTEAGSAAFGTYEAGESFDPVTVQFSTDADCAAVAEPAPTASPTPVADEKPVDLGWLLWLIPVLVLLIAAIVVVVVRRRRAS